MPVAQQKNEQVPERYVTVVRPHDEPAQHLREVEPLLDCEGTHGDEERKERAGEMSVMLSKADRGERRGVIEAFNSTSDEPMSGTSALVLNAYDTIDEIERRLEEILYDHEDGPDRKKLVKLLRDIREGTK